MADENAQGAAQGTTTSGEAADTKPVTMADIKALFADLPKEMAKIANQAITSHAKRAEKAKAEAEAAKKGEGGEEEGAAEAPAGQPAKPAGAAPTTDPQVVALEKKLARLERQAQEADAARKKAERERAEEKGHGAVRKALSGKVAAEALDLAHAALRGRGAIHIDDDGNPRFRFGERDEPEEGLDLDAGIERFLRTKEAAFLKPAATARDGNRWQNSSNGAASANDPFKARTGVSLDDAI